MLQAILIHFESHQKDQSFVNTYKYCHVSVYQEKLKSERKIFTKPCLNNKLVHKMPERHKKWVGSGLRNIRLSRSSSGWQCPVSNDVTRRDRYCPCLWSLQTPDVVFTLLFSNLV